MLDKVFNFAIVAQTYNITINEIINKFKTIILFLQIITKKIDSSMQNMIAFISIFNIYILRELDMSI